MSEFRRLAIIGVGPSAVYLLQHLLQCADQLVPPLSDIYLFEKGDTLGVGMPYDRRMNDAYNLCNISSAEMPPIQQTLVQWLHAQTDTLLSAQGIARSHIDDDETYRRTTIGEYFHAQYAALAGNLRALGVTLHEFRHCIVQDVKDHPDRQCVEVRFGDGERVQVDRVVVATGHSFNEPDEPTQGYFASPWPMQKLVPDDGSFYNFEVGTLGASLSAFDVVSSLSHRHGAFVQQNGRLVYEPLPAAPAFRLTLHSAEGWLPHLQYEQVESFRIEYRHVDRDTMLSLRDSEGFLSLDAYFDRVCRPTLAAAFQKDGRADLVDLLTIQQGTLEAFVHTMSEEHTADDPFVLMRLELQDARRSLRKGIPIHWKEALDDLMYTLNFHYEHLSAEDHLRYRRVVVPFLMNVIAAMPLHSASILLALHEAGRLELIPGRVSIKEQRNGRTVVEWARKQEVVEHSYRMFINCSGQGGVDFDAYPFASLAADGTASAAVAYFRTDTAASKISSEEADCLVHREGRQALRSGGVAIDGLYRLVGTDGLPSERIQDIAAPHATGVRPYSYGLQACDAAASIVVKSWCAEIDAGQPVTAPS